MTIDDLINQAIGHHSAGDLGQAERIYRRVLSQVANHPVALHLSGVLAYQSGDADTARKRIAKAIKLAPDYAEAHSNLGLVLHNTGDNDGAEQCLRRALAITPDAADTLNNLGNVLDARGERAAAADAYARAIELAPDFTEALYNLGTLHRRAGRIADAVVTLERALGLAPDSPDILNGLGLALIAYEEPLRAIDCLEQAARLVPSSPDILSNLGNALRAADRPEQAADAYERALAIDPDYVNAHHNLGRMAIQIGDFDAAAVALNRALELQPNHADAFFELATNLSGVCRIETEAAMRARFDDKALPTAERSTIGFGLSALARQAGDFDRAFADLAAANRLRRETLSYDADADARDIEARAACIRTPRPELNLPPPPGGDPRPIFIVGMPRSGTTLIEQILAGHSGVTAAGEVHFLHRALAELAKAWWLRYPADYGAMTAGHMAEIRAAYLAAHRARGTTSGVVTDKLPHNFLNLCIIRHAFPDATVVHVRRDAVDTCFSIFEQNFTAGHPYSLDLAELGAYYRRYENYMAACAEAMPALCHEVGYEALIANPEREIRALLDACGLDFESACLHPHETKRTVLTASRTQVRRPINASSVKRWRPFAAHLGPLIDALGRNRRDFTG